MWLYIIHVLAETLEEREASADDSTGPHHPATISTSAQRRQQTDSEHGSRLYRSDFRIQIPETLLPCSFVRRRTTPVYDMQLKYMTTDCEMLFMKVYCFYSLPY